uniref:Uncharacterized protein n=1 Tax=Oscillatoriales cyanobacterium SpSt-402 TaxID=2282168 RepID=A0A832H0W5_9CYAN
MTAISFNPNQSYQQSLNRAAKVNWQIEDIIGGDKRLDFTRRFIPEALARVSVALQKSLKLVSVVAVMGLVPSKTLPIRIEQSPDVFRTV